MVLKDMICSLSQEFANAKTLFVSCSYPRLRKVCACRARRARRACVTSFFVFFGLCSM